MQQSPYWWDAAPLLETAPPALPERADTVVVGSGYTGLSAAMTLARGGRDVLMVERQRVGEGASSRNLGLMSGALKISFAALMEKAGLPTALALYGESARAREYLKQLITTERIDCDVLPSGRFTAAVSAEHYEYLAKLAALTEKHLGLSSHPVARAEQDREVGSDRYFGGWWMAMCGRFIPGSITRGCSRARNPQGYPSTPKPRSGRSTGPEKDLR